MQKVRRLPRVVIALGQLFGAAATSHVEPMHRESGFERVLRHALLVTGVARPFESMNQNQLPARFARGTLRIDHDAHVRLGLNNAPLDRETLHVQLARPEVAENREQVWIADEGLKLAQCFQCTGPFGTTRRKA